MRKAMQRRVCNQAVPALRALAVAIALSSMAVSAANASSNLVVNGGFESGDFLGWTLSDTSLTNAAADQPHSGLYEAKLGNRHLSTLDQLVPTVAGQTYTIDLFIGRLGLLAGGSDFSLTGSFAGEKFLSLNATELPLNSQYVEYTGSIKATSNSSLLDFSYVDQPSYILLDDISVTGSTIVGAVPEPSFAFMLLLGVAGVAGWSGKCSRKRIAG